MKKVFIAVPMKRSTTALTDAEIQAEIDRAKSAIPLILNIGSDEIEFLNPTFTRVTVPDGAKEVICYLCRDLELIAQADYAYFCKYWGGDSLCMEEEIICHRFQINTFQEN